jgi:transcriptional regulator with XRE-family HTH domain
MRQQQVSVLPEALRAWRRERGWTQEQLAERAGCSSTLIALIETGKRQPGLANAIGIARAIGVPLTALAIVHVDLDGLVPAGEAA